MKETKVYVDKLPKSCYICHCFDTSEAMCSITGTYTKFKQGRILEDCPLIDIKTHDRKLVKEVCEKIKNNVNDMPYYDDRTGYVSPIDVCEMIDELQKEYKK